MKSSVRTIRRFAANGAAVCLVGIALLLSVTRFWLLPRMAGQRPELEREIGRLIGETVSISAVSAHVRGLYPELVLTDFRIVDVAGGEGIRFQSVRVGIHPLESLLRRRLAPMWVTIHGTRLSLRRDADGSFAVLGLTVLDHPPAWILAAERIELLGSHIEWQDLQRGRPPIDLGRADLRLSNAGEHHRLSLSTRWGEVDEGGLQVRADLVGNLFRRDRWGGRIYAESAGMDAARLNALVPGVSRLRSGAVGFRIWSDWSGGEMTRLAGRIDLRQPTLVLSDPSDGSAGLKLAGLESWFRWRDAGTVSLLEFDGLRVSPATGSAGPASRIALGLERNAAGQVVSWRAAVSRLRLDDVAIVPDALAMLPVPVRASIRDAAPQGELRDLKLVYRTRSDRPPRFAFCGELSDFRVNATAAIPGLSAVAVRACGSDRAGHLTLRSARSELAAPMIWSQPVRVRQAQLGARWRRTARLLRIESDRFMLATPDFTARGRGAVELPDDPAASPRLDLQFTVSEVGVRDMLPYLPDVGFPATARYLTTALTAGRIMGTAVRVQGPISRFPFASREGNFEAVLDIRNLDMLYSAEWPAVQGIDGRLRFSGDRVEFAADTGRTGNGEIAKLRASVPSLLREPRLIVDGLVRAGVADTLDFMRRTPLRRRPDRLLQWGSWSGNVEIGIGLDIPLEDESAPVGVVGSARLKDAALVFGELRVAVGPLTGDLAFTGSGLKDLRLSGAVLGEPVTIAAASREHGLEVRADGLTRTSTLRNAFDSDIWRVLDGAGAYRLEVELGSSSESAAPKVDWRLQSDLRGVRVNLPPPLGKAAETPSVLEVSGRFEPGNRVPMRLSYDHQLQGALVWSKGPGGWRLARAQIARGCELPEAGGADGIKVVGRFGRLDADDWEESVRTFGSDAGDKLRRWARWEADLAARELVWAGHHLGAVNLTAVKQPSGWHGSIGGDLASGRISWEEKKNGYPLLELDLERLAIPRFAGGKTKPSGLAVTDSRTLPGVHLRSRRVLWKGVDLGELNLSAERQSLGLMLKVAELKGDQHRLNVSGDWLASAGKGRMRLNGRATADSLGDFAERLGAGSKIKDTRSVVDFQLSWPGSPLDFRLPVLSGDVALRMEEGTLLQVDPGWGRMFGFLSLSSVWRRINLDFRDLVTDGLAYDRIEGKFRIADGKAVTSGFLVDGAATRIVIDGSADLAAETLDQIVTVIPRTSVALPIAGTLAGGRSGHFCRPGTGGRTCGQHYRHPLPGDRAVG